RGRVFDEDLFMYCEDVDLNWRAQLAGWGSVFAPAARVYHRLSATGGGPLAPYYCGRNFLLLLAQDVPRPLLRRYRARIAGDQRVGDRAVLGLLPLRVEQLHHAGHRARRPGADRRARGVGDERVVRVGVRGEVDAVLVGATVDLDLPVALDRRVARQLVRDR